MGADRRFLCRRVIAPPFDAFDAFDAANAFDAFDAANAFDAFAVVAAILADASCGKKPGPLVRLTLSTISCVIRDAIQGGIFMVILSAKVGCILRISALSYCFLLENILQSHKYTAGPRVAASMVPVGSNAILWCSDEKAGQRGPPNVTIHVPDFVSHNFTLERYLIATTGAVG